MQTTDSPEYLTVPEVAERFRCSPAHLYGLAKIGELPHVRLGDSVHAPIRIEAAALERWLADRFRRPVGPS